jgi:hypothetical protein
VRGKGVHEGVSRSANVRHAMHTAKEAHSARGFARGKAKEK